MTVEHGKYRKKPVVIEAYKLPDAGEDVPESFHQWCEKVGFREWENDRDEGLLLRTREGVMRADPGDWIIRGVADEFYPCKPDIFAATYDTADTPAEAISYGAEVTGNRVQFSIGTQRFWLAFVGGDPDENEHMLRLLQRAIDALAGSRTHVPDGMALVPSQFVVSKQAIEGIYFTCGGDDEATTTDERWCEGVAWVGDIEEDDGTKRHGLHLMSAEYPEEGSITITHFTVPSTTIRTPRDYAIEHAGYLAKAAKGYIQAVNELSQVDLAIEDDDGEDPKVGQDLQQQQDAAREQLSEATRNLHTCIFEFEKRRDRAVARETSSRG